MERRYYAVIDFMRALLIMLVILVHIVHFGDLHPDVKSAILSFMMPAFLFITGYLVNIRKPLKAFLVYILQIALPYVLMVTGYMLVSLHLPVRDGITAFDLPTVCRVLFVTSIGPYWFLRVMIICGLLYYVSFNVVKRLSTEAKYCVFACLLIGVAGLTPILDSKTAVYYFLGAGTRLFLGDFTRIYRSSLWAVLPFVLLAGNKAWQDWSCVAVLLSILCFFSFTAQLSTYFHGTAQAAMLYIGRNTLPIYIFHPIFTMAAKYALPLFAFDPTGLLHAVTTVVIGIAGCIGIGKLMDATRASYVFGKKRIMR